jgi:hypothetical protein
VQRVARRFALVAVAGELATEAGLTGWAQGEVSTAAAHCLRDWIEAFGGIGNHEERAILEHVRAFIEAHGSSRFESMTADRERISNRVGYIQQKPNQAREYLIFPEAFKREVCKGFDAKQAIKALVSHGILMADGTRPSRLFRTPDSDKPVRMYAINADMLFSDGYIGYNGYSVDLLGQKSVTRPVTGLVTPKNPLDSRDVTNVTGVTEKKEDDRKKSAITANGYPLNTGFAAPEPTDTNALTQGGLDL